MKFAIILQYDFWYKFRHKKVTKVIFKYNLFLFLLL